MLVVIANEVGFISWVARRPIFHQITEDPDFHEQCSAQHHECGG
jgi:hypothetical protein